MLECLLLLYSVEEHCACLCPRMVQACCGCGGGTNATVHTLANCQCGQDYYDADVGPGVRCEYAPPRFNLALAKKANARVIDNPHSHQSKTNEYCVL